MLLENISKGFVQSAKSVCNEKRKQKRKGLRLLFNYINNVAESLLSCTCNICAEWILLYYVYLYIGIHIAISLACTRICGWTWLTLNCHLSGHAIIVNLPSGVVHCGISAIARRQRRSNNRKCMPNGSIEIQLIGGLQGILEDLFHFDAAQLTFYRDFWFYSRVSSSLNTKNIPFIWKANWISKSSNWLKTMTEMASLHSIKEAKLNSRLI